MMSCAHVNPIIDHPESCTGAMHSECLPRLRPCMLTQHLLGAVPGVNPMEAAEEKGLTVELDRSTSLCQTTADWFRNSFGWTSWPLTWMVPCSSPPDTLHASILSCTRAMTLDAFP